MSPQLSGVLSKLKRVQHSIASSGLRRTAADLALRYLSYSPEGDRSFDRRFDTDTAGSVEPAALGIGDAELEKRAILYLPSPPRVTRWMLEHVGVNHEKFSFVDLGCGKGRVLLVASEFPFIAIHGVDISAELCGIARSNAQRYRPRSRRCERIDVHHGDAAAFAFPDTNLLVHLYHPFDPALTERVLARLGESYERNPRHLVIAYLLYTSAIPEVEGVFSRFPWLRKARTELSVTGQYDWLFYSSAP